MHVFSVHWLTELDLRNNRIDGSTIGILAEFLGENHSLLHLDLRWNNIGEAGGKTLLSLLERNSS